MSERRVFAKMMRTFRAQESGIDLLDARESDVTLGLFLPANSDTAKRPRFLATSKNEVLFSDAVCASERSSSQ